jgi:hypothetical protein
MPDSAGLDRMTSMGQVRYGTSGALRSTPVRSWSQLMSMLGSTMSSLASSWTCRTVPSTSVSWTGFPTSWRLGETSWAHRRDAGGGELRPRPQLVADCGRGGRPNRAAADHRCLPCQVGVAPKSPLAVYAVADSAEHPSSGSATSVERRPRRGRSRALTAASPARPGQRMRRMLLAAGQTPYSSGLQAAISAGASAVLAKSLKADVALASPVRIGL